MIKKKELAVKNIRVRATEEEMKKIKAKALEFTGGNLSLWLKTAAINYVFKRSKE